MEDCGYGGGFISKSGQKTAMIRVALSLLLILSHPSFCADLFYDSSGILKTVDEGISSIRQGNLLHTYSSLTTQNFKDSMCFNDFLLFISEIPALYNNTSLKLGMSKVEEKAGIYEGEIRAKEGEKMGIHFELTRGKTRWLIDTIIVYPLQRKELPGKKEATILTVKDRFLKFFGLK